MKIARLGRDEIAEFRAFNREVYPERPDRERRIDKLVLANPYWEDHEGLPILVARNEGRIVGQFVLSPFLYEACGRPDTGYWGWDYVVLDGHRESGAGAFLAAGAIKGFTPYFGLAPSDTALGISRALKVTVVASLKKFLWLRRLTGAVRVVRHMAFPERKPARQFPWPSDLRGFRLAPRAPEQQHRFGGVHFETLRPSSFLQWRFCDYASDYGLYTRPTSYFVVRRVRWRGLALVALVDFRCALGDTAELAAILDAAKMAVRDGGDDGLMVISSHRFFDRGLVRAGCFRVGREAVLVTNAPWAADVAASSVRARLVTAATMGDSDMELSL